MTSAANVRRTTAAIIPGRRVVFAGESARVQVPAETTSKEPHIELVRESDVIRAIDVTCSCGQKIRLVCDYEWENTQK
jgi:hypothetical protein